MSLILDLSKKAQTIEGFGVSGAWWSQIIGGWGEVNRKQIIDLLFDRDVGIGLSIYRYNVGGGAGAEIEDNWRRTETFEVGPRIYDWSKDEEAIRVLKEVHQKGVEYFVAFANSPPARMTKSKSATGEIKGKSNLREDMYEAFADYLIDVANHLRNVVGIPITYLSPINEPQWDWKQEKGQEGCHYTPDECLRLLRVLSGKMEERSISAYEISAIEAGEWQSAKQYIDLIYQNKELMAALSHFDVHSYWSTSEDKIKIVNYMNEHYPTVKLNMSEWTEMKQGRDYGMDSALVLANVIHDDLTLANVTSWQYWIAVSKYDFRDGLIYTNEGTEDIEETKRLWAMGNYSKYIKPGSKRVILPEGQKELKVSVFYDEKCDQLIYVLINNDEKSRGFKVEETFNDMEIIETSKDKNLFLVYKGPLQENVKVPPKSITTLILTTS